MTESNSEWATAAAREISKLSWMSEADAAKDIAAIILKHFQPEWVSVQKRLPEEHGWYMASKGESVEMLYFGRCTDDSVNWSDMGEPYKGVTHWCPLPSPPRTAEQESK